MDCRMWGNFLQNPDQNLPLQILQSRLRRLDQSNSAETFGQNSIMVMPQPQLALLVAQSFQVCEPSQLTRTQAQPLRQVPGRFNAGNIPLFRRMQHLLRSNQQLPDKNLAGIFR